MALIDAYPVLVMNFNLSESQQRHLGPLRSFTQHLHLSGSSITQTVMKIVYCKGTIFRFHFPQSLRQTDIRKSGRARERVGLRLVAVWIILK